MFVFQNQGYPARAKRHTLPSNKWDMRHETRVKPATKVLGSVSKALQLCTNGRNWGRGAPGTGGTCPPLDQAKPPCPLHFTLVAPLCGERILFWYSAWKLIREVVGQSLVCRIELFIYCLEFVHKLIAPQCSGVQARGLGVKRGAGDFFR